jgi:hypothetical protein
MDRRGISLPSRVQQAVEMDHHILHLGIIDAALGRTAPGFLALA